VVLEPLEIQKESAVKGPNGDERIVETKRCGKSTDDFERQWKMLPFTRRMRGKPSHRRLRWKRASNVGFFFKPGDNLLNAPSVLSVEMDSQFSVRSLKLIQNCSFLIEQYIVYLILISIIYESFEVVALSLP
jgi:hypothetical protein